MQVFALLRHYEFLFLTHKCASPTKHCTFTRNLLFVCDIVELTSSCLLFGLEQNSKLRNELFLGFIFELRAECPSLNSIGTLCFDYCGLASPIHVLVWEAVDGKREWSDVEIVLERMPRPLVRYMLCAQNGFENKTPLRDHRYLVCCASHNAGKGWRKNPFVCPWSVECKPTSTHDGTWKIVNIVGNHTCSDDGSNRKRNYHRNSLEDASQVLQTFIPSKKCRGATHQLTTMMKATDGLDLKAGQAHNIVQEKSLNGMHVHIGQYLLLPSYLDWLKEIDPDGNLVLETQACSWTNKEQFKRLYTTSPSPRNTYMDT